MHVTIEFILEPYFEKLWTRSGKVLGHSGLAASRFHFTVMDFFRLRRRRVFSGLGLRPARRWPLWQSWWMMLRLSWAFQEKNTSSVRTSLWPVAAGPARLNGAPATVLPVFQRLQEKLAAMRALEFGTMTAREFFLYQSQPMQGGARYTRIARFGLE